MLIANINSLEKSAGVPYTEIVREPSMSVGLYELAAGTVDLQQPHTEDEVYYVIAGRSQFSLDEAEIAIEPGTVIFVPAGKDHRFHTITEDLSILVFFAPAEYSRGKSS